MGRSRVPVEGSGGVSEVSEALSDCPEGSV